MKKSVFLEMVQNELDTIKKRATKREIGRLNILTFNHKFHDLCIYGQMTGYCESKRAKKIMVKTFENVVKSLKDCNSDFLSFSKQDNKTSKDLSYGFTPLEKYLYMVKKPMHKKIIQYLKGEIININLK